MDEIKQYKERLQIALKAAKICIFEVDLLRQLYTFFENAEVIFGISGEEILKDVRPYSQLDPEAYRLAVSEYFSHPDDTDVIEGAFRHVNNLVAFAVTVVLFKNADAALYHAKIEKERLMFFSEMQ